MISPRTRYLGQIAIVALVYVLVAKFGLSLAYVTPQVTTVWPATGIALALLLLFGYRFWPGIFLGAMVANGLTHEPLLVATGIAVGNTLEAVVGTFWLRRLGNFHPTLDRLQDVFGFIVFGAIFATAISATIGVISLSLGQLVAWQSFAPTWETWWVGDMMGAMIVAPLILIWSRRKLAATLLSKPGELAVLTAMVLSVSTYVFTKNVHALGLTLPLEYLVFPLIVWAAVRFKQVGVVTTTFIVAAIAVWGTIHGRGPFSAVSSIETNLILLQLFMFVASSTGIILGAIVNEWKTAEATLTNQRHELQKLNRHLSETLGLGRQNEQRLSTTVQELEETKGAMMNVMEDLEHDRAVVEKDKVQAEAMLMAIGDGLVVIDEQARVVLVNQAFEQMTGWTARQAAGRPIYEVLPAENEEGQRIPNERRPYSKVMNTGQAIVTRLENEPYFYVRRDGTRFPVAITVTPMILAGKLAGTINVFRDITHELDIDRAKSEFVSLASHELRTPLTIVRWSIDMLQKYTGSLTTAQKKYVKAIEQTGQEMVDLVDALLNVSRIEMGTLKIEPVPAKLGETVTGIIRELKPLFDKKSLALKTSIASTLPVVRLDPQLFRVAMTNLLTNAIKYTPAKGTITVNITADRTWATVTVTDTGYGIPEEDQSKIFTKLFRADNIKKFEAHGTGLGLYVAKAVVEQSGGKIWFSSQVDKGSSFSFRLPLGGVSQRAGNKTLRPG